MEIFFGILLAVIVIVLAVEAIFKVPENHYALKSYIGKFIGGGESGEEGLDEGPHLKIPFLEKVVLFDRQQRTAQFAVDVYTGDEPANEFVVKGSVKYRPSLKHLVRWSRLSATSVNEGLVDSLRDELVTIISANEGDTFVGKRRQIGRLINAMLCMEESSRPHRRLGMTDDDPRILEAYERSLPSTASSSEVEARYGIVIEVVDITDADYSEPIRKAREKKRIAEEELKAAKVKMEARILLTRELKKELPADQVDSAVAETLGYSDGRRQIISVTGSGSAVPLLNISTRKPKEEKEEEEN